MDLQTRVNTLLNRAIEVRRHLHQNPELSFQEHATQAYLKALLAEYGLSSCLQNTQHGLVYCLHSGVQINDACLLLRADMDALPIQEQTELTFRSQNTNVMHACGHDVHMTVVAFTAIIMKQLTGTWQGTLKIIFQPGEEVLPGGASLMIQEGVLENPRVTHAMAIHVQPSLITGTLGFCSGSYMASSDELRFNVKGRGGHAALRQMLKDPVLAASELIVKLNERFQSECNTIPTVLSIGRVEAAGATNVIPDQVHLEGTLRTRDELWRKQAHEIIKDLVKSVSDTHELEIDLDLRSGYPCLINDASFTHQNFLAAQQILGSNKVVEVPPRMTAEDFSYFTQRVPSCFFRLGTGYASKENPEVHSPRFEVDEQSIYTGIFALTSMCLNHFRLQQNIEG